MTEPWETEARRDLAPKVASSEYVVAIAPDDIDPKQALGLGYAILLDKPLVVVAPVGRTIPPGLRRIASKVIELRAPLTTDAGGQQLMAELAAFDPKTRR